MPNSDVLNSGFGAEISKNVAFGKGDSGRDWRLRLASGCDLHVFCMFDTCGGSWKGVVQDFTPGLKWADLGPILRGQMGPRWGRRLGVPEAEFFRFFQSGILRLETFWGLFAVYLVHVSGV